MMREPLKCRFLIGKHIHRKSSKVHGCAQHSKTTIGYWRDLGRIEREAFANMFQSCFEPESARYMAEYFPEAYKEFKKMIKGVVG